MSGAHYRDSVHSHRVLWHYPLVVPPSRAPQVPRLAVVYSPVAVGDFPRVLLVRFPLVESSLRVLELRAPAVVRSPVAVDDFLHDSRVLLLQVQATQRPAVAYSRVVVDGFRRDLTAHCSLVVSALQLPAQAPAVAPSMVVVRDYRRVHPLHCSLDERLQSNRPELAYPEVLA